MSRSRPWPRIARRLELRARAEATERRRRKELEQLRAEREVLRRRLQVLEEEDLDQVDEDLAP